MMAVKHKKLGRGLSALLGEEGAQAIASLKDHTADRKDVPISWLSPGRFQPRRQFDDDTIHALAQSIQQHGILQPLLIRPTETAAGSSHPHYEIIAGERRWRAAQKASLDHVPVIITHLDDEKCLRVGLVENLQRQNLNPLEEAKGYQRLMEEFKRTQEDIADIVGKSRSHVANSLRILTLPPPTLELVETGALTPGHARMLVGLKDAQQLAQTIVFKELNVRDTEKMIKKLKKERQLKPFPPPQQKNDDVPSRRALELEVSGALGLRVHIEEKGEGGIIRINYKDLEQLGEIVTRLKGDPMKRRARRGLFS
ncbi:MAG: ParB/RepB/Spo0J family partition protein [Alphaproteobacteria bacterium GM7ARS4]|nr:ParB/RepB/Spo0J family partition protein [Alphaproteobacteria bacterium GM7ARS4]